VRTALPRLKHPLAWFVLTELVYVSAVRLLFFNFRDFRGYSISMELYWTALRVMSIIALVLLFKPLIWNDFSGREHHIAGDKMPEGNGGEVRRSPVGFLWFPSRHFFVRVRLRDLRGCSRFKP